MNNLKRYIDAEIKRQLNRYIDSQEAEAISAIGRAIAMVSKYGHDLKIPMANDCIYEMKRAEKLLGDGRPDKADAILEETYRHINSSSHGANGLTANIFKSVLTAIFKARIAVSHVKVS
jgi:hypothetical protein